ncbi:hypothetical protein [Buttiauxella sp. S19-1]|uniref:hypothetical protein n=1 Tax=Buttiauxella sp. S19-1 TaxID=941430 RepID=UPI001EDA0629|nr:hypothetical protein [Buttiauxella sp. S19-1]
MTLHPTFEGYLAFVRGVMGVPDTAISDDSPTLKCCYNAALEIVNVGMGLCQLPTIYTATVYNAGASLLLNHAIDIPPSTYFADIRKQLGLGKPVNGLVNAASDQGTAGSITIGEAMSNLTLADLMMMQDPYGRQVVAVLMEMGPIWGYTP